MKGIIVSPERKVLITQEPTWFDGGGKWELPGGKLDEGEEKISLEKILLREIQEELGNIDVRVGKVVNIMRRPWNKPDSLSDMVFLAVFECLYQTGEIVLSEENNHYRWVEEKDIDSYEFIDGHKKVLTNFFKERNLLE